MVPVYEKKIMMNARVLFIQEGCPICLRWKKFIERFNLDINQEKRVLVVDATNLSKYGIYDHPLFKIFDKHIEGFPSLFIDGNKIGYTNSREEAEAFIRAFLHNDFIEEEDNPLLFDVDCRLTKKGELVCEKKN